MVTHAPSIFDPPKHLVRIEDARDEETTDYDFAYEENGFSYGSGPIPPATIYAEPANMSMEFMTPAPKLSKKDRRRQEAQQPPSLEHSRTNSLTGTSDKKRKRGQPEKLSLSRYEEDVAMTDVSSGVPHNQMSMTPTLNHSGLTGGLSQMMRTYSPSPEYRSDGETYTHHHPVSPIKRTRRGNNVNSNNKETNGHNVPPASPP
jgi:cell growth-regulating nucleolar protein